MAESDNKSGTPPVQAVSPIALTIPWSTYLGVLSFYLLISALFTIWPLMQLIAMAVLLAVTLSPIVAYAESRGMSRSVSLTLLIVAILAAIMGFFWIVVPSLFEQAAMLSQKFPGLRDQLLGKLPANSIVHKYIQHLAEASGGGSEKWYDQINTTGGKVINALWEFGLLLVVTIYLLVDGPKLYRWILAFFSFSTQKKIEDTAVASSDVIFSYVYGQAITSGLVMLFALSILYFLKVPAALILALCAAVFDIFPVVGFVLAAAPAVLLALTVSPFVGLTVGGAYVLYHCLENYYIVPKVYGKKLRLSTFTVLVSLLVGWELAGVVGGLLALPIVASYAHIESIWLTPYLNRQVSQKHEEQKDEEFGEKVSPPPA